MIIGTVYLVGAGPGDPGLITVKGLSCLTRADVIVYDRLSHPDLIKHSRESAEKIFVGKESAFHAVKQDDINALLVKHALTGKSVCRLKGGDPFVFGRGGEEAEYCREHGVPFVIVPGVTSAIAAPAYAGIPVTHRDVASSFAIITGHERDDKSESGTRLAGEAEQRRDWSRIAHAADTLLFLMGVESLPEIVQKLIENGRETETPVALVRWGTRSEQQTVVGTLQTIVEEVRKVGLKAPAVIIVGEVVRWRDQLAWFDNGPLFGKRVLVTRAREQASALTDLLHEHGAQPVEFPTIQIVPLVDYSPIDEAIRELSKFQWVVFTSANGVEAFWGRLRAANLDARAFGTAKVSAIGPATAEAIRLRGINPDFVPSSFIAEAVITEWPDSHMSGSRVLIARAQEARDVLPEGLVNLGANVTVAPTYQTVIDAANRKVIIEELMRGEIDIVTFTSSSTVRNFMEAIGANIWNDLQIKPKVACIGPVTAETATELGLKPDIVSEVYTIPGLVNSLLNFQIRHGAPNA